MEKILNIFADFLNHMGRPYPFMVFKNLEVLGVSSVHAAVKVGDTAADIKEGKNTGMISVGIIEGSSVMGLTEEEFRALAPERKAEEVKRVREFYQDCGADYVISNMSELPGLIARIENS